LESKLNLSKLPNVNKAKGSFKPYAYLLPHWQMCLTDSHPTWRSGSLFLQHRPC